MAESRSLADMASLAFNDLRTNRGRRLAHGARWRSRRLKQKTERVKRAWAGGSDGVASGDAKKNADLPTERKVEERLYSLGYGSKADYVLEQTCQRLTAAGIRYMLNGLGAGEAKALHIHTDDVGRLVDTLIDLPDCEVLARSRDWRLPVDIQNRRKIARASRSFDLLIVEDKTEFDAEVVVPPAPSDDGSVEGWEVVHVGRRHIQCSRLQILLWRTHNGAYGKRLFEVDRQMPTVRRLREATFHRLMKNNHDFDTDLAGVGAPTFDIDVVYTWVDGDDPEWLAERSKYSADLGKSAASVRVNHDERFRNRDELRYSLRSLHLFAPWVRNIYIVTMGQTPSWLNVDHPKIHVVDHRDIYTDPSCLPTFNSSSIETQLHHVPGLARKFIYFNDDVFLGQYCYPKDFFAPNGAIKCFPSLQRAYEPDIDEKSEEYVQADKNAIELIASRYPFVGRHIMQHVPHPADRDLLYQMEQDFPDAFAKAAAPRFRSSSDLRPIAFMQFHYGYHQGLVEFAKISHRYLALWKPSILNQLATTEKKRSAKTFCVNDVGLQPERLSMVNRAVVAFLESYFPAVSPYENGPSVVADTAPDQAASPDDLDEDIGA